MNNTEPFTHAITKITTPNYSSCFQRPKRVCDVKESEISRFTLLCKQSVETISIFVPRKTSSSLFQEDIFPPVPSTVASNNSTNWMSGVNSEIDLISMKPADIPSIYDVSEDQGGKNAEAERIKRLGRTGSAPSSPFASAQNVVLPSPEVFFSFFFF